MKDILCNTLDTPLIGDDVVGITRYLHTKPWSYFPLTVYYFTVQNPWPWAGLCWNVRHLQLD